MTDETVSLQQVDVSSRADDKTRVEMRDGELTMPRSWIRLSVVCLACGSLLMISTNAADTRLPVPSSEPTPAAQPAEPTPVDEPTPAAPQAEPQSGEVALVPKSEQAEDKGPWEVTDRVELIFKETLALKGDKALAAKVQLKNKSDSDIAGKLVLVVDESSVPGVKLDDTQGQFTETTPYVQIVPARRSLEPGQESPVKSIILRSTDSLKDVKVSEVQLRWRAFTLTKPAGLDDEPASDEAKVPGKNYSWGEMRKVMQVQDGLTPELIQKHGGAIVGTATSENENGQLVIRVFAARGGMSRKLPGEINGIPVEVSVTGEIKGGPATSRVVRNENGEAHIPEAPTAEPESSSATSGSTANSYAAAQSGPPTGRFNRPVPIGVSSINQIGACASGTLGCRCRDRDGNLYVLSNNHVYGRLNAATVGDPLVQPSPGDNGCAIVPADVIATMRDFQRMSTYTGAANFATAPINIMDAAVGLTPIGQVDVSTPLVGYGTPHRVPQENVYVGMLVQKCGRTTGYTKGKITSLNAEAAIGYTGVLARFRSCIVVQTAVRQPAFGAPGDSGSLVVTQSDRRPVGLLFAGGGNDTFLNPISPVLHRFKFGIDDGTGAAPVLGSGRMGSASGPVKQFKNVKPLSN